MNVPIALGGQDASVQARMHGGVLDSAVKRASLTSTPFPISDL